jgi:hypothetical protein
MAARVVENAAGRDDDEHGSFDGGTDAKTAVGQVRRRVEGALVIDEESLSGTRRFVPPREKLRSHL